MNIALILSGGTGSRLGAGNPKQYLEAGNRPIICYCIRRLSEHERMNAIQIVADAAWQERIREWLLEADPQRKFRGFSAPGATRQLSVLHGLEDIRKYAGEEDRVFIHDAARPLLSKKQISDCLEGLEGHDGVVPVLPMKDTIYCSRDGRRVFSLLNRGELFAGQTPEAFVLGKYLEANRRLLPDRIYQINGSAEAAVLSGLDIVMIPGDENNFKITTKEDLERFRNRVEEEAKDRTGR